MFLDFECGNSYMTYTFLKTYRTVYLKRVSFIVYKFYLNKPDLKKKKHLIVYLKFKFLPVTLYVYLLNLKSYLVRE